MLTFDPLDEEFMMAAFHSGDPRAFNLIYKDTLSALSDFILKMVQSPLVAEDIVSECYCKLFYFRTRLEEKKRIRPWLFLTARNECIDYLRKKQVEATYAKRLHYLQPNGEDIETAKTKAFNLIRAQTHVDSRIDFLSKQRKLVITKYYFEHKSTDEIAKELNITTQTVRNNKNLALSDLRKSAPERPEF